ncbi:Pr6Pr family membrane protein [Devosia sediminis]|uniref:Pr6Pr family membrane protein n=1 Tax=Devosia sediminis TaxID=2798801 RepID=A0A934IW28_9HYPH|nr:Pr6Pr family membrane protein [Devosia sediminis]MBJ3785407.1 Pr6Pr family membrane protein [Devosia sediminis]
MSWLSRISALLIALAAWLGLGIHVEAQMATTGSLPVTLWILGGYFTVLTNLIVVVVFTLLVIRPGSVGPRTIAGVTISIVLVGVVYGLLLQGLQELTAGAALANVLLHRATPLLVPIYWLVFVPRGALRWVDPLLWAAYPVAYLGYALLRGSAEGHFAYPFIDYVAAGVPQVVVTVAIITAAFLICGMLMVWFDRALAGRTRPAQA